MLDLDFSSPLDQIRMNVGDADGTVVSDNMINSALVAFNDNVYMATVAVMGAILTDYSRLADREREGNVEVYYTNDIKKDLNNSRKMVVLQILLIKHSCQSLLVVYLAARKKLIAIYQMDLQCMT